MTLALAVGGCAVDPAAVPYADGHAPVVVLEQRDVSTRATRFTYRVRALLCDKVVTGSAFATSARELVTNKHVVEGATRIEVESWDGKTMAVVSWTASEDRDLAVVRLAQDAPAWGELGEVRAGDDVWVVGYPEGGRITVAAGKVVESFDGTAIGENATLWRVTAEVREGNSGGPLVTEDGRIAGTVFAYDAESRDGYALSAADLRDVMASANRDTPAVCPVAQ